MLYISKLRVNSFNSFENHFQSIGLFSLKIKARLSTVAHTYNPSSKEAGPGGEASKAGLSYTLSLMLAWATGDPGSKTARLTS